MKKETKARAFQFYLGVDGGGTKCTIAIMSDKGRVVAEATGGPANPLRVGVETAVSNIAYAIDKACDDHDISRGDIVAATLGLAGVRRHDIRERVRESFLARFRVQRIVVTTDAEIALYGTTLGNAGLVVIAGTGSICLGVDASGRRAMAGGWGPIAGDEGGGRGIAGEALHRIAKASDGRGPATALSEQAAEYFRASNVENLIGAIYAPTMDNSRIAGFSRLVTETAKAGDPVAIFSETQSRPVNVHLAELALLRLGARPFHVVVPSPAQTVPVPIRSTGATNTIGGLKPIIQALGGSVLFADLTTEGMMHAPELPEILKMGARGLYISNEHPDALERLKTGQLRPTERKWQGRDMHGTIGAVARAADGTFAVSCSTGGTSMMLPGRVGDSPIFGAGTMCGEHGAVCATGDGEEIIRRLCSMRVYLRLAEGMDPQQACEIEVENFPQPYTLGLIAVSRTGHGMAATADKMARGMLEDRS